MDLILNFLTIMGGTVAAAAIIAWALQRYRTRQWKRKFTWDAALRTGEKLLTQIRANKWEPDVVIGIGRSGGIWGGWLAGNLGSLPFSVVDNRYSNSDGLQVDFPAGAEILSGIRNAYPEAKRILLVEGATSTGKTPTAFKEKFKEIFEDIDVKTAVLYKNPASTAQIEFVGEIGPEPWPASFPWHFSDLYRPYLRDIITPESA